MSSGSGGVVRKMGLNGRLVVVVVVAVLQLLTVDGIYVVEKGGRKSFVKMSPAQWTEPEEDGLWSSLLEEYTLGVIDRPVRRDQLNSPPARHLHAMRKLRGTSPTECWHLAGSFRDGFVSAGAIEKLYTCPDNFTRVHDICYHFGVDRGLNWKSASTLCKSYGGHLAEFESSTEFQDVVAYILNNQLNRGKEFWLGGLNPGLLWIWTQSAKPVNPNTNLTSITKTGGNSSSTTTTTSKPDATKIVNKTQSGKPQKQTEPTLEITGTGRCLKLSYNGALYTYGYSGQDCSARFNYICELKNKGLDNEISRIAKQLELD
ncbi:conserved hypothetical protein [Culex quinquefasciatus]|uniref:C-type lectin domain-containing protein n=1 Tax=Culex quinquefasciatus TaxID=7176 RepID=B0WGZ1_CULQU|nr:conserved hypothetical protein [Culex quinquefasciatus]|eukprot:XP_001847975.1 conserved hypothetical protein [Culex quinquefasciatus]